MSESAAAGVPPGVDLGLVWGIKGSFVGYVHRMPDGRESLGAGAYRNATGAFVYPPVRGARRTGPDGGDERIWEFTGDVRFGGHFGVLFLRIATPRIALRDGAGELTITDQAARDDGSREPLATVRLRSVPAPDGLLAWDSSEVLLHPGAVALFNDVYPAGEPLDRLSVVLPDR